LYTHDACKHGRRGFPPPEQILEEDEDEEELEEEEDWEYETESEDEAVDREIERRKSLEDGKADVSTRVVLMAYPLT